MLTFPNPPATHSMKPAFFLPLACALLLPASGEVPAASEQGVLINAADLLGQTPLLGPNHRVRDQVATDGFMAHFEVDTDFGTFSAIGVPQARVRIAEAEALRKLVETSKSDLFAEGMRRSIEKPIDAVKNIVTHPVEVAKSAPATVGHFFGKVGSAISRGSAQAAEKLNGEGQSTAEGSSPSATDSGRGLASALKSAAGFDTARLDTARQLGIDPYSDNIRLQEEIDKVTWAFFAGGLPLRIGASVASAGMAVAATQMLGIPEDVYALTRSELELRDERALATIGITAEDVSEFQRNPVLTLTRRHRLVTYLEALPTTAGRGNIIRLANSCTTPPQADFLIGALAILAERQREGLADYRSLTVLGRLTGATLASGVIEVPAPVDFVTWTEEVAGFASRDDLSATPKTLVHTGQLSQAAADGFLASGWNLAPMNYPTR